MLSSVIEARISKRFDNPGFFCLLKETLFSESVTEVLTFFVISLSSLPHKDFFIIRSKEMSSVI